MEKYRAQTIWASRQKGVKKSHGLILGENDNLNNILKKYNINSLLSQWAVWIGWIHLVQSRGQQIQLRCTLFYYYKKLEELLNKKILFS